MKKIAFAIILFTTVLVYGCKEKAKTIDDIIVGSWKTTEAQVNVKDAPAEMKKAFEKMILNTKYEFGADKSFTLKSEMEEVKGSWSYDKEINALLLLEGTDAKAASDTFKIKANDENSISFNSDMGPDGSIDFKIEKIIKTESE